MEDILISFETAKLAKEKGFDEPCEYGYNDLEDGHRNLGIRRNFTDAYSIGLPKMSNSELNNSFTSPTQSLLQKWLREQHKIRIFVIQGTSGEFNYEIRKWNYDNNLGNWQRIGHISSISTYEESLEQGLIEALKLI